MRAVGLLLALVACRDGSAAVPPSASSPAPAPSPSPAPSPAPAPASAPPRREALAELIGEPDAVVAITPPDLARVERVHVRLGDQVLADAPVVTLVMPDGAVAAARAASARDRLATIAARRAVVAPLVADGLARAVDLAELDARAADVRGELALAQAELRAHGLREGSDGRLVVRAPRAGVVVALDVVIGSVRGPTDGALATVAGGDARRVVARWLELPVGTPRLVIDGADPRALTVASVAPRRDADGAIAVWYDVAGAPIAGAARARVVVEAAP